MSGRRQPLLMLGVAAVGVALPFAIPDYRAQIAMLWALVIMAQTWDITGGQTGYNSFGNILFFGVGMYASVVVQRDVGLDYFPRPRARHGGQAPESRRRSPWCWAR